MKSAGKPGSTAVAGRLPMLLTAFVWPGAGQFVQRRWVAGLVFTLSFLACSVAFFVQSFRIIATYYSLWLDFNSPRVPDTPHLGALIVSLGVGIALYVAAIIDVQLAQVRRRLDENLRRMRTPPQG